MTEEPRGPGRPPATETRERILEAAIHLFGEHGFAATSIQRVADEAGMSKQALQHHFPTKGVLRAGVYHRLAMAWAALLDRIRPSLMTLDDEHYIEVVDGVAALFAERPAVTRFLIREMLDAPDEMTGWLLEHGRPWLDAVAGVTHAESVRGRKTLGMDAEAHTAVIALLLLSLSALLTPPGGSPPADLGMWRGRLQEAARALILRGSQLAPASSDSPGSGPATDPGSTGA